MASTAIINSDLYSFEEKIFFISQAQRYFIVFSLTVEIIDEPWFFDYLDDMYYDSINTLFKSFYLECEDGYDLFYKNNDILVNHLSKMIYYLSDFDEISFESFLKKKTSLDYKYDIYYEPEFFCQKISDEEKKGKYPIRVHYILSNVLKMLKNECPINFKEFVDDLKLELKSNKKI